MSAFITTVEPTERRIPDNRTMLTIIACGRVGLTFHEDIKKTRKNTINNNFKNNINFQLIKKEERNTDKQKY